LIVDLVEDVVEALSDALPVRAAMGPGWDRVSQGMVETEQGALLRRELLVGAGFAELDDWLGRARMKTGAKPDDIIDACAVALAARDRAGSVPQGEPPRDAHGVAMQIWF
jgi:predicted RNase H-like nuclease